MNLKEFGNKRLRFSFRSEAMHVAEILIKNKKVMFYIYEFKKKLRQKRLKENLREL